MTRRAGFTLIELVVVIMILGILAGVAAPKLFNTSATAGESAAKTSLAIVRDAIEMYAAQNGGLPQPTTGADLQTYLVTYIRGTFPVCPVGPTAQRDNEITIVTGAVSGVLADGTGWKYSKTTGEFIVNNPTYAAY